MEKNKYESKIICLGLLIKELRINKEITQEHLSTLCEVDVRTIQRIEKGRQNISISLFFTIAEALNVKSDILIRKIFEENI